MEEVITKRYKIKKNAELFDLDKLINLRKQGFFHVHSDYESFGSGLDCESSIFHYKAGTTIKIDYQGHLEITGLENKVEETKNAIVTLGGEVKELDTFSRI